MNDTPGVSVRFLKVMLTCVVVVAILSFIAISNIPSLDNMLCNGVIYLEAALSLLLSIAVVIRQNQSY